jgi:hypothetical protein
MPTGYNEELKRDIYRDLAAKQHLAVRLARSGRVSACDATETETAEDYCKRMLQKLGLKASRDPIADLTMFLAGHDTSAMTSMGSRDSGGLLGITTVQGSGMDSDGDDFMSRYLRS